MLTMAFSAMVLGYICCFYLFFISAKWNTLVSKLEDPELVNLATKKLPSLLLGAKATSTTKNYLASWRRWEQWSSSKQGISVFPVAPFELALYIAHLADSGAKSTADNSMAAIKYVHNLAGLDSPTDDPIVKLALQGFRRHNSAPTVRKEPIDADVLSKVFAAHGHDNATLSDLRILFVIFISYSGFLRYDDLSRISRSDCVISADCLNIKLRKSKNDQFRQGSEVNIARTFQATCPVAIAERFFAAMGDPPNCPLPLLRRLTKTKRGFIPSSIPLSYTRTREIVLAAIKPHVADISRFGLHSLRSGGASAASNAHVPPLLISMHGRWKTDKARNVYLQADMSSKLLASRSLGI